MKTYLINKAREFAISAHGDQKYGTKPYIYHLDEVDYILRRHKDTPRVIGYLHNTLEDTEVGWQDIVREFGDFVCSCVIVMSVNTLSHNRAQRVWSLNILMRSCKGKMAQMLIVKAADRLANVRECVRNGDDKLLKMYADEYTEFRLVTWRPKHSHLIWSELDRLYRTVM